MVTRKVPMLRWVRPPLRLRFRLLRSKRRLVLLTTLLSRETSSSPSREGTGSSWRRVPILFCTGHCSGSRDRGSGVPDASALPAGSSTTPILVEDKERAADSMPPPPARKEIVLALRAPSVVPVVQPKGRKRKFNMGGDGESSQQGGSNIASGIRGKFMLLIDGMISECGSETSRLAGELLELQEATDALRSEFQARLAKISAFPGPLECIRNRDLALATIEGGVAVVQSFQSETPPTLEAEEARLSGCKGDLAVVDGDFDLILADLKSACFLPTWSEGPEGKDPVLGESGGDAAPGLDEATGEEGA
ncbi:unnamed protein product [Brassica oleracea var. botrytis]